MIYRGEKILWLEFITRAVMAAAFFYFTVGMIWQMAKGWFV